MCLLGLYENELAGVGVPPHCVGWYDVRGPARLAHECQPNSQLDASGNMVNPGLHILWACSNLAACLIPTHSHPHAARTIFRPAGPGATRARAGRAWESCTPRAAAGRRPSGWRARGRSSWPPRSWCSSSRRQALPVVCPCLDMVWCGVVWQHWLPGLHCPPVPSSQMQASPRLLFGRRQPGLEAPLQT